MMGSGFETNLLLFFPRGAWGSRSSLDGVVCACGCFRKLRVHFLGVLILRFLLFGVYVGAPDCCKFPCKYARACIFTHTHTLMFITGL